MTLHSQLKLALRAHQQGEQKKAQRLYLQILDRHPHQPDALHYLGLLQAQQGAFKSGVDLMLQSLKMQPRNISFLNNLGNLYRDESQYQAALTCFSEILKLSPDDAEVLNNRALVWLALSRLDKAQQDLLTAVRLAPERAAIWFNLGRSFQQENTLLALQEAEKYYLKALDLNPNYARAWNSLGNIFLERNQSEQAIEAYQKALVAQGDWLEPLVNLASAYAEQSHSDLAITTLERVLSQNPGHATARLNYAQLLLLKGRLGQGFTAYEASRWNLGRQIRPLGNLDIPLWQGEEISTLLLCCEQGFGDSLQFIRFLPQVQALAKEIWLECPRPLERFFAPIPNLHVIAEGMALPKVQAWAPLLRLPHVLGTELADIPAKTPYLEAPERAFPQDIHSLRLLTMSEDKKSLKIGVVWGTGYHEDPTYLKLYQRKSTSPQNFEALAESCPQHLFFSLQVGRDVVDLPQVHNLSPYIHDFGDTAALMQHLDLVIATDTAVAHLAGALGKTVWLLLPKVADWRWLEGRSDSPWYPTMRLFRQSVAGSWTEVFSAVFAALQGDGCIFQR